MSFTIKQKLIVYQTQIAAPPGGQVGFEYDLEVDVPDLKLAPKGAHLGTMAARCDVVQVTGSLSFPNPAAPVISPFKGLIYIYDNAPILGFSLTMMAEGTEAPLTFFMNMAFPAPPLDAYSGAIKFGEWPGPFRNVTAAFLSPI